MLLKGCFNVKVAQSIRKVFRQVLANCDNSATGGARIRRVMRDHKYRQSVCPGTLENEAAKAVAQSGIEPPERLVEKQRPWLRQQHAQERDTGPLSAGKCRWIAGLEACEACFGQRRGDPLAAFALVESRGQPEGQVACNR